jgi:hypothetical protein
VCGVWWDQSVDWLLYPKCARRSYYYGQNVFSPLPSLLPSSLLFTLLLFSSAHITYSSPTHLMVPLLQFGATSTHVAASKGHVIPLKLLLDRGAELEACDSVRCSYVVECTARCCI